MANRRHHQRLATQECLAYAWSLRTQQAQPAARWRLGQRLTLKLSPWADHEATLGAYQRGDFDDNRQLDLDAYFWVTEVLGED